MASGMYFNLILTEVSFVQEASQVPCRYSEKREEGEESSIHKYNSKMIPGTTVSIFSTFSSASDASHQGPCRIPGWAGCCSWDTV